MANNKPLMYSILFIGISLWMVQVTAASISTYAGFSGCLFSSSICRLDESCFDDNLFGTCSFGNNNMLGKGYRYQLSGQQMQELESILQQLVAGGFTWRHLYTQCVLAESLSAYRRGLLLGATAEICTNYYTNPDASTEIPAEISTYLKQPKNDQGYKHGTWRNASGDVFASDFNAGDLKNTIHEAYEEFAKFIKELTPEDLRDLKRFLLEETADVRATNEFPSKTMKSVEAAPNLFGVENVSNLNTDSSLLLPMTENFSVSAGRSQSSSEFSDSEKKSVEFVDSTKDETTTAGEAATVGVSVHRVKIDQRSKYSVALYVLLGTLGIVAAVFAITCIQYCRAYHKMKKSTRKLHSSGDPISEIYEDLCRQHMTAKLSETHEKLGGSNKAEPVHGDMKEFMRAESYAPAWKEEAIVQQIDSSAGTVFLTYMEAHLRDTDRLEREWTDLSASLSDVELTCFSSVALEPSNTRKNRCSSILPYESSRVKLNTEMNSTGSDYINASYIVGDDPRKPVYIATQGPLSSTEADFWQMVWEQKSTVIINLTCLMEDTVSLCHRYWPGSGRDMYHVYEITLLSEHEYCDDYIIRNFSLRNTQTSEVHDVTQFHYLSWPAELPSVPESHRALLEFRRRVNKSFRSRSPAVVHCSDGAGRTGTYCLIDMVLNRLVKGVKEVDLAATLEHLREQRHSMVQTKEQFEFAFTAVAQEVYAMLCNPLPTAMK